MSELELAALVTDLTLAALALNGLPVGDPAGAVWMAPGPVIEMKGEDKQQTSYLRTTADEAKAKQDAAIEAANKADPNEQRLIDKATALDDWETGKAGPIDIHNMPTGGPQIALYEDALKNDEAGRVGRGTMSMTGGANPNFTAALDHEDELKRKLAASGALEEDVNTALHNKDVMLGNLGAQGDARNMQVAGMRNSDAENAQSRDLQWRMRPKQPGFLKQLALSAAQGASSGAASAAFA